MKLVRTGRMLFALGLTSGVVVITLILESLLGAFPKGLVVGSFEVVIELSAVAALLFRRELKNLPRRPLIASGVFFLATADAAYIYFYYFLQIGQPTPISTLLASGSYVLAFVQLFAALFLSLVRPKDLLTSPVSLIPLFLLTPVAFQLAVPLFKASSHHFLSWIDILSLTTSYFLFAVCLYVFLAARDEFWMLMALGPIIFLLSDWSIKALIFQGNSVSFVGYEFLWALGIFLLAYAVIFTTPRQPRIARFDWSSVAQKSQILALFICLVLVFVISMVHKNNIELVKTIAISSAIAVIGCGLLAQIQWDYLDMYAQTFAKITAAQQEPVEPTQVQSPMATEFQNSFHQITEQVTESTSQFDTARAVAHDIRVPLGIIKRSIASMTQPTSGKEDETRLLKLALERVEHIANDLLDKSRKLSTIQSPAKPATPIKKILEDVLTTKNTIGPNPSPEIQIQSEENLDQLLVQGDRVQLARALTNLVNNAIESQSREPIQIGLRTERHQNNQYCEIQVIDHGVGISADVLEKLNSDVKVTSGKTNGNGVGVWVARKIIRETGGELTLESALKNGTTARIRLLLG